MKLYTFEIEGKTHIGAEQNDKLVDLTSLVPDMLSLIKGNGALQSARQLLNTDNHKTTYTFQQVRLRAPILRPGKILCSGVNYRSHGEENPGAKIPTEPFFFSKLPSAVIGPGDPIRLPKMSQQVDYEVEFAVVIGKALSHAAEGEVMEAILGYTLLHDVSARDVQFKDSQITLGKNFDTFSPLGPCLVTTDEIPNPDHIALRTYLNGKIMQDGSTQEWVFSLPKLISFLSQIMTLEPGDVVSTGTPAGVGYFRKPQVFLKPGDKVVIEAEGIGQLENPVIASH